MKRRRPSHERQIQLLGLLSPLPAVFLSLLLLARPQLELELELRLLLGSSLVGAWLAGARAIRRRVERALQSLSTLLGALGDGDYSVRGRPSGAHDSLDQAIIEINELAQTLSAQRVDALEAGALLSKVITEIDVAVFAFDQAHRLKLINRAGERLLAPDGARAAAELLPAELTEGTTPRTVELALPGGAGQWELRRSTFRLQGLPHELIVLTDLRRALRQEEQQAWQRVIRVIGHEINNSLAPIGALAADMQQGLQKPRAERPADFDDDLLRGLAIIDRRAAALGRFMGAYSRLAKLPPPRFAPVEVAAWLERVVQLERRLPVQLRPGPALTISGDGDQLDQLLINLVQNGVEAAIECGGGVEVTWRKLVRQVEVIVSDEGPGVSDTANLFVPFFTTKPNGSGIGLLVSRQICEAHRGTLTLETRQDRSGALARLRLPL